MLLAGYMIKMIQQNHGIKKTEHVHIVMYIQEIGGHLQEVKKNYRNYTTYIGIHIQIHALSLCTYIPVYIIRLYLHLQPNLNCISTIYLQMKQQTLQDNYYMGFHFRYFFFSRKFLL